MIKCKHSIKKQYSIIFGLLLLGAILFISIFNLFTLKRFYQNHRQRVLLDAYKGIKHVAQNGDLDSDDFNKTLKKYSSVYNISILILDSDTQTVRTTDTDAKILTKRLLENIFRNAEDAKTVYNANGVSIHLINDTQDGLDYLELWGNLDSSNFILMRCAVESLAEPVRFSNHVFMVIGFISALVGVVIIWLVTNQLTLPIMRLVLISEKMAGLDFSEKYEETDDDNEINILGAHINKLSDNLERTIIELKEANAQLQKDIDKKNEIDEMRKEFVANVSHELKTPIALIQGYAEGLKDCVNDDEESKDFYCDVIVDEASRMNRLVRNLLDLNELEFGKDNIDVEQFDIVEVINNCLASFDILIKSEDIKCVVPDQNEKILVWADEFQVEQILNNYISNAIHHVSDSKIIEIKAESIENIVRVSVFNSGEPIPDDVMPNIWTKFYKADKARTREYGGSGIGLSIVKASMEAMGHDYGAKNVDGGVEFWFEVDANKI